MSSKKQAINCIKSFATAEALTVSFALPTQAALCEDKMDLLTTRVYELLGEYSFLSVLLFVVLWFFYSVRSREEKQDRYTGLSIFFSICLLVGNSFAKTNSFALCFGSVPNLILFGISIYGLTVLLCEVIPMVIKGYENVSANRSANGFTDKLFDSKHVFRNAFLIIYICWLPAILLSYPGNLCYDVLGEISQAMGDIPLSTHHPLLHILLVGAFVKFGELVGNLGIGLFLYVLFQSVFLALSLATTLFWLKKEDAVSNRFLLIVLGLYVLAPMYSNMASTAIKDIPFMSAVIWYIVMLAQITFHRAELRNKKFLAAFVAVQILVCLLRNNGLYLVALTSVVILVKWWKRSDRKQKITLTLTFLVLPIVLAKLINGGLMVATGAKAGSSAEALSIPLQQTARYLQVYSNDLTHTEKEAIERLLGPVEDVAAVYNPDLADPVKSLIYFRGEDSTAAKLEYLRVWFVQFFKHPGVYIEAFLAHIYGWYDPAVTNAPRYEVEESIFSKGTTVPQKLLLFWYRFADKFTPLSLLQNVGIYTWLIFILFRILKDKNKDIRFLTAPLIISLLICMAAPCFYLHPRYAYPYMFILPFFYGFALKKKE